MVAQLADAKFASSHAGREVSGQTAAVFSTDETISDPGRSGARAILVAMLIASPFWVLVAFTIYLLL